MTVSPAITAGDFFVSRKYHWSVPPVFTLLVKIAKTVHCKTRSRLGSDSQRTLHSHIACGSCSFSAGGLTQSCPEAVFAFLIHQTGRTVLEVTGNSYIRCRHRLQAIKSCDLVEHLAKTRSISRVQQLPWMEGCEPGDSSASTFELSA